MRKIFLLVLSINLLYSSNLFIIKNRDGTVKKSRTIKHKRNIFFDDIIEDKKFKKIGSNINKILRNAKKYLGGKYVWGGTKPTGFDCSGYVQYLYKKEGIFLPRTAYEQSKVGLDVKRDELKKGDLLFFLTDKKRNLPITHVGIYLGNDSFIHAASKKRGIIISSLSKSKYNRIFVKATRIIE